MTDLSPLKIFASYYIDLQEKMSSVEKKQIRAFIEAANQYQVIALMTEGKMRTVRSIEETLLESSFANDGMDFLLESKFSDKKEGDIEKLAEIAYKGKMPKMIKPLSGTAHAALVLMCGYSIYRESIKNGMTKTKALKNQIAVIERAMVTAKECKNPKKSLSLVEKKLTTLRAKLA